MMKPKLTNQTEKKEIKKKISSQL